MTDSIFNVLVKLSTSHMFFTRAGSAANISHVPTGAVSLADVLGTNLTFVINLKEIRDLIVFPALDFSIGNFRIERFCN